jgi:hypothetical protein
MWAKLALAAAAVTTLVGCYGSTSGTTAQPVASAPAPTTITQTGANGLAAVASTYTLVAIDGHTLPYARSYSKGPVPSPTQVLSGTLSVQANGTFAMSTKYRAVERQVERVFDGQFTGACAPDGNGFRLYWDGGGETALNVRGDTATVDNDGVLFRYLRQR